MANNFRTIYLYIIALITLSMIIGGIVSTVNNITSYFYPDSLVFFQQESNSKYDTTSNQIAKENYKNGKIKNAVVSVAVIAVGAIMYRYHWSIIEREKIN